MQQKLTLGANQSINFQLQLQCRAIMYILTNYKLEYYAFY